MFRKLTQFITTILKWLIRTIFPGFSKNYDEIITRSQGIPIRYIAKDLLSIISSVGFFTFLNILGAVIFIGLPQGKDVVLIIIEDLQSFYTNLEFFRLFHLFFLAIGVLCWSLFSEFGTRYSIYVSDNTAKNLPQERVRLRKSMQRFVAGIYLVFPFIIIYISLFINAFANNELSLLNKLLYFFSAFIFLQLIFSKVTDIYFNKSKLDNIRKKCKEKNFLRRFVLSETEISWVNKLHGIYNDYIFSMPKPENFAKPINNDLKNIIEKEILHDDVERSRYPKKPGEQRFPQTEKIISNWRVPSQFNFIEFQNEPHDEKGEYRWIFEIPLKFYKGLHNQLRLFFWTCVSIITLICFLQIRFFEMIGPPALVCLAFACIFGVYAGILYVDYAWGRRMKVSLRFTLLLLLVLTSVFNHDHPLRVGDDMGKNDTRPELVQHYNNWLSALTSDSNLVMYASKARAEIDTPFIPVIFVCAEGGALRTGAFAALMLSHIQQDAVDKRNINFARNTYAYSTVSGGSLGIGLFYAINYLQNGTDLKKDSIEGLVNTFFKQDYLSPVLAKMFYGDILQQFIPVHIPGFDRAIALERSWERSYNLLTQAHAENIFSGDYLMHFPASHVKPAFFINTTEIETGTQCWITNVVPNGILRSDQRDLLGKKIRRAINYSTAINFSTRFPLLSPAAAIEPWYDKRYHYVDGGYVENTGAGTMLEVLQALRKNLLTKDSIYKIRPYVICLRFQDEINSKKSNITAFNELSEVIYGMVNSRGGRTSMAVDQLKKYTEEEIDGKFIELGLAKSSNEVPMNWILSKKSIDNISKDINEQWKKFEISNLRKLYFLDTLLARTTLKDRYKKVNKQGFSQ